MISHIIGVEIFTIFIAEARTGVGQRHASAGGRQTTKEKECEKEIADTEL